MYFSNWYTVSITSPPLLSDKIENMDVNEIQKQIKNVLSKLYSLCEYLMDAGFKSVSFLFIFKYLIQVL